MMMPWGQHDDAAQRGSLYPLYLSWIAGMGMIPEIREQWRYECLTRWGNATRPIFGLLWSIGDSPLPQRPLRTIRK